MYVDIFDKVPEEERSLTGVGLGYVGMPIAVAFARKGLKVIGFAWEHMLQMLQ